MLYKMFVMCLVISVSFSVFAPAEEIPKSNFIKPAQYTSITEPDIDMFIGNWKDSKRRSMYGSLDVYDILTKGKGDPLLPRKKGAVLTDINRVSFAVLKTNTSTETSELKREQLILYIYSGIGVIKTSDATAELREGIGVLIPPGVKFKLNNHGTEPLTMYIIEEPIPRGFDTNKHIVLKDEFENPISTNTKRAQNGEWLFGNYEGLSTLEAINPVMYEPRSLVQPHVHAEGVEEVWIALRGDMRIIVGNQRRELPEGSAYKVPQDTRIPHLNINYSTTSKKLMWMMKVPSR